MSPHSQLVDQLVERGGVVMLVGGLNTGKTLLARQLLTAGLAAGRACAYIDADLGQTTIGPPACVAMKVVAHADDLDDEHADELRFVGAISPDRFVLQQVIGTAALVQSARSRADFVVVDTTSSISGVIGQTLKYHKVELASPDVVVALQRGSELEPIIGMLKRFFSIDIESAPVHPDVVPQSPEQRAKSRADRFATALAPPLGRWKVRPTVFAPTLPAGLDLSRLNHMLVGAHDGHGRCLGLGTLEFEEADSVLRVLTGTGDGLQGLRLGSLRLDPETFDTEQVNLRELMFGL